MGDTEEGGRSIIPPDFLSGGRRKFANVNEVIERRKTHFRNYPILNFGRALMEAITEDEDSRILSRMTYNQKLNSKNANIAEEKHKGVLSFATPTASAIPELRDGSNTTRAARFPPRPSHA